MTAEAGNSRDSAGRRLARWLVFNAVGAFGIVVQLTGIWLLAVVLQIHYLLATAMAVELAVLHNFCWHWHWTWADRGLLPGGGLRRLLRFNVTTGVMSIAGNVAAMALLAGWLGLPYLVANLLSIAVCSIANFMVSDLFVFSRSSHPAGRTARRVYLGNRRVGAPGHALLEQPGGDAHAQRWHVGDQQDADCLNQQERQDGPDHLRHRLVEPV
jgi:putative flippase GtrA